MQFHSKSKKTEPPFSPTAMRDLSNFSDHDVSYDGNTYRTVEHAFQALKYSCTNKPELVDTVRLKFADKTGVEAKSSGGKGAMQIWKVALDVACWENKKVGIMKDLIASKMERHPEIRQIIKVAKENDITLVHFSRSDMYWGAHVNDTGTGLKNGQNMLGKLYMSHYDTINNSESTSEAPKIIIQEKEQGEQVVEEKEEEIEVPEKTLGDLDELEEVDITVPTVPTVPMVSIEPITNPDEEQETDKLNVFYELKNKYETNKYERCNKVIRLDNGSWKLKRKRFAMCKPKCIVCNRRVGSIFSIKYATNPNNVGYKSFIGKCGDIENPCPFNIEFNITNTVRVDELYIKTITELNRMQKEVINAKNNAVFGIIKPEEAVDQFNNLQKNIDSLSITMEQNMTRFFKVIQNESKKEELKQTIVEFNEHVASLKLLISKNPEEVESIKTADIELNKFAEELSNFKYVHREVVDDEYNVIFSKSVASKHYTYLTTEFLVSELEIAPTMEVINFNIGNVLNEPPKPDVPIKSKSKKKSQTKKNAKQDKEPKEPKNKTLRREDMRDISDSLNDLFQSLIIEDRLSSFTANEAYKMLEGQYKIKNAKEMYGNIIRSYLKSSIQEWTSVSEDIVEVAYKMVSEDIPRGRIFAELNDKFREKHPLTETDDSKENEEPINYEKKYKRVINEMLNRYDVLLENVPPNEPKPKPDWPKNTFEKSVSK